MYEALVVGLIMGLTWFVEKVGGTCMVMRPLVVAPLVGLALGELNTGLLTGASLELVFMGAMQIGVAVPPDVIVGAGLGTAFAILAGEGAETALALALPISILAQSIKVAIFIVRSWFMDFAMQLAKDANIRGLVMLNWGGLLLQCLMYFAVGFVAILVGSSAVSAFVDSIPDVIMNGLTLAGNMIPAVGFALLLQPMMGTRNCIYFILGFVLAAYLGLPTMAITIIGVVFAFVAVYERGSAAPAAAAASSTEEDDLFDD